MSDILTPIRVSELPEVTEVNDSDYLIIDDGTQTSRITSENFNKNASESAHHYADEAARSALSAEQYAGAASGSADTAAAKAQESNASAQDSEAWAVGQRAGQDVPSTDETYHNNSKYFSEQAHSSATEAAEYADDASDSADAAAQSAADIAESVAQIETNTEDISDLKSAFDSSIQSVPVTFTTVPGEYVKSGDGIIYEDSAYARTDYFDVSGALSITLYWTDTHSGSLNAIVFYDETHSRITGSGTPLPSTNEAKTHDIPSGTKYAIFSGLSALMGKVGATLSMYSEIEEIRRDRAIISKNSVEYLDYRTALSRVIGVTKFPGNLVIASECRDGQYINYQTGYVTMGDAYFRTGWIPVTAGKAYKSNYGRNHAWYDASYQYISGTSGTSIQSGITAPENAAYIRFTINKSTDGISDPNLLYFADVDDYSLDVTIPGLKADAVQWCYGKKINWIGDSIVAGNDFDEKVTAALGLIETDYGINGSTIALNGDGTDGRNALCVRYTAMTDDTDIVAVSCGTNDFEYAWSPIGDIESTENTTFYGALKTLCAGLIAKYPQKLIFFTTPIKRAQAFADGAGGEYTADGVMTTPFSKNKYGKTLMDYADIIKEVCGYYSIPVLDMYRESLLNPHLSAQQNLFDNVYTHPNATGQAIMARRVAGWLTQLGYQI